MFTTQLACEQGDVRIGWEDANDEEIRAIIKKKLAEGYHFFRQTEQDPDQHIRIRRIGDVGRHVIIPDDDINELFTKGKIGIVQIDAVADTSKPAGPERVREAEEVMQSQTVAHRAHRGG